MIKILMTAKHLDAGGIETFIRGTYPYIDKDKIHIDFIITKKRLKNDPKGYFEEELIKQGAKIYRIAPKSKHLLKSYNDLKKIIQEHPEYKVLHINDGGGAAFPLFVAKRNNLNTCIVHSHNSNSKNSKQIIIMKLFRKYVAKNAKLLACSDEAGQWMFGEKGQFDILHNGIDSEKFQFSTDIRQEIRKSLGLNENQLLIGHVGRFNQQKNHTFLIDIFEEVCKKIPDAKLLLIGEGELENKIKTKVKNFGLEKNVIFLGKTKYVYKYLSAMDFFLSPSLYEGLSVAHIEAQCNGLSCILSDNLPKEIVITNKVLMISLDQSAKLWSEEIVKEYTKINNHDREKYMSVIKECGFDVKEIAKKLGCIYQKLC